MLKFKIFLFKIFVIFLNRCPFFFKKWILGFNYFEKRLRFDYTSTFRVSFPINSYFKFILIGANDGVNFDSFSEQIAIRDSYGLALEPSPKYFKKLLDNYKLFQNVICLNLGIHKNKKDIFLYEVKDEILSDFSDWVKGIGSFNFKNLTKHGFTSNEIVKSKVKCVSFSQLIEKFPDFCDVDFLQIDTEGYDAEIIKSIDFNVFSSKMIKYENINLKKEDFLFINELLKDVGYLIFNEGIDTIALNSKIILLFK